MMDNEFSSLSLSSSSPKSSSAVLAALPVDMPSSSSSSALSLLSTDGVLSSGSPPTSPTSHSLLPSRPVFSFPPPSHFASFKEEPVAAPVADWSSAASSWSLGAWGSSSLLSSSPQSSPRAAAAATSASFAPSSSPTSMSSSSSTLATSFAPSSAWSDVPPLEFASFPAVDGAMASSWSSWPAKVDVNAVDASGSTSSIGRLVDSALPMPSSMTSSLAAFRGPSSMLSLRTQPLLVNDDLPDAVPSPSSSSSSAAIISATPPPTPTFVKRELSSSSSSSTSAAARSLKVRVKVEAARRVSATWPPPSSSSSSTSSSMLSSASAMLDSVPESKSKKLALIPGSSLVLPRTPMCGPNSVEMIGAAARAAGRAGGLQPVAHYTLHILPDVDHPRPPKAKATPLTFVLSPSSTTSGSSSFVPVRLRFRPQAPRSFRNVVKSARLYTTLYGVAAPLDATDRVPHHFLYFSLSVVDGVTRLAGPQSSHLRTPAAHAAPGSGFDKAGDRTRRQAKFKHADDKKEYQGHVQVDLSQPGPGARLELRLFSLAPSTPSFFLDSSLCEHKFARIDYQDLTDSSSSMATSLPATPSSASSTSSSSSGRSSRSSTLDEDDDYSPSADEDSDY